MAGIKQVAIAFDQLVNTMFGGWADETLSSRAWRWHRNKKRSWPKRLIEGVFFWEKHHCRKSYESEVGRLQCPVEMRQVVQKRPAQQ